MSEAFELRYQDVLQNIESAIVGVYRSDPGLVDHDVDGGLEALISHYTAEMQGRPPRAAPADPRRARVFEEARRMCEWRLGRDELVPGAGLEAKSTEEIVACLKRIRKSVQKWTKREGRQGYLSFINQYVP